MSRLSRPRAAVATGLTLGAATAGLLFAPAAFAADSLPAPTISPATVAPGGDFAVSGVGCLRADGTPGEAVILPAVDPQWADNHTAATDGSWTLARTAPSELGTYEFALLCDRYTDQVSYSNVTLTVTADGKPVATAAPAAEFTPGSTPNTPGIGNATSSGTGNVAAPGQKIVKVLKGFQPNEVVTLVLHSTPTALGTFTADANGVVTAEFTLPAGTALGQHTLTYDGSLGSHFEDALTLTADGKALAYTGVSIALPLIGGTALVAAGAGALVIGRRRRPTGAVQP
jgi:hypothetical protein